MKHAAAIAKHFREAHFGGNWSASSLKELLRDVSWQQATTKVDGFHDIATLVFHMNYYIAAVTKVLEGGPLEAHDKFSFDCPAIRSDDDWTRLTRKALADAERFAALVEQIPDETLHENLDDPKYGTVYRNLHGIIEHCHYHFGQIAMLRKLTADSN